MSSETVAKSVGKKLRYYFEVKRLEDGFDLSGVHSPQLNHPPLKSRPTLQYDGLHDRALKHYFSMPEVKTHLTKMQPHGSGDLREDEIKHLLKVYMYKHRFVNESGQSKSTGSAKSTGKNPKSASLDHRQAWGPVPGVKKHPTMPGWMYKSMPNGGKKLRPEFIGFGVPMKSHRHKQFKGGWPVLRSVPPEKVSRGEAHRLIDVATKILVATEKVDGMRSKSSRPSSSKRQAAPKPFEKSQRPSTAKYTWDINGRRHLSVKAYDDSFIPDWVSYNRRQPEKPKEESKKPKSPKRTSPRPLSAKYRHRPDLSPQPPRPTVINIPEPEPREDVTVSNATQTSDTVGIQTEKKLLEEYDHTEDEVQQGPWAEYQIYVRTGNKPGAATKADVKVTLYGEKGRTKEFTLKDSRRNKIKFQTGKEDVFVVAAHYVGKLRKIKIGHDRPELAFGWFLDGVSVFDMFDKRIYEFECKKWLSGVEGDKKTYRDLKLDRERGFVEAFDEVRQVDTIAAGRDRRKVDESSDSRASKDDKRSVESIQGSRRDKSDSESSTTSYSSSSASSTSSRSRTKKKGQKHKKKEKSPETKAKTPPPVRELSPPRKPVKDDFFDKKPSGPTFTFRTQQEDDTKEEFLTGYKAGLEAASAEQKQHHDEEETERKKVLQGPTIHDAARLGNLERMQQLLKYYPEMKEAKDETGFTPLHIAVQQGRIDIVKWLTASNINLNTETPTGYTAMHIAATNGHVNCMIVLAAMGAALTCRSVDRQTPLHLAAMNGHLECVKWLIANRSSLEVVDALGRTPLQLAEEYQHQEVADFIKKCQEESHDPKSTLYDMRSTNNKGLEPIREQSSELSLDKMWKNDSNVNSSRDVSTTDEYSGRMSQKYGTSQQSLESKRRMYEEQQEKMHKTGTSFLDSIRDEAAY